MPSLSLTAPATVNHDGTITAKIMVDDLPTGFGDGVFAVKFDKTKLAFATQRPGDLLAAHAAYQLFPALNDNGWLWLFINNNGDSDGITDEQDTLSGCLMEIDFTVVPAAPKGDAALSLEVDYKDMASMQTAMVDWQLNTYEVDGLPCILAVNIADDPAPPPPPPPPPVHDPELYFGNATIDTLTKTLSLPICCGDTAPAGSGGLYAATLALTYDRNKLTFTGVVVGSILDTTWYSYKNHDLWGNAAIGLGTWGMPDGVSKDGPIAVAKFAILGTGATTIELVATNNLTITRLDSFGNGGVGGQPLVLPPLPLMADVML